MEVLCPRDCELHGQVVEGGTSSTLTWGLPLEGDGSNELTPHIDGRVDVSDLLLACC